MSCAQVPTSMWKMTCETWGLAWLRLYSYKMKGTTRNTLLITTHALMDSFTKTETLKRPIGFWFFPSVFSSLYLFIKPTSLFGHQSILRPETPSVEQAGLELRPTGCCLPGEFPPNWLHLECQQRTDSNHLAQRIFVVCFCVYVWLSVCKCTTCVQEPTEVRRGCWSPGTRVLGSCKLPFGCWEPTARIVPSQSRSHLSSP